MKYGIEMKKPNIYRPNKEYQAFIRKLDPGLEMEDEGYVVAVVLLGLANARNTSTAAIAEEVGLPANVVRPYRAKARAAGIIAGKNSIRANWNDPKDGWISFWMDC